MAMVDRAGDGPEFGRRLPTGGGAGRPDGPASKFVYDGNLGELYAIFLVNLLLTIVTATIYRFWAKTKMRRYLWSHVSLEGDRFEYTGTGGELFVGFLIVIGFYLVAYFVIFFLEYSLDSESIVLTLLQIALGFVILYLVFVAQYAAQRYRLTRTLWRGIRGGMTGSAWAWGFKAMFFAFLSGITLTLAGPWTQMRLIDDRLNNSYFGDAKASIQSSSKPIYIAYFVGLFVMALGLGGIIYVIYLAGSAAGVDIFGSSDPSGVNPEMAGTFIAVTIAGYLGVIVVSILAFSAYYVAMAREIAAKLQMGSLRFATPITMGRLINRYLWNMIIIVATFGLGLPIAIHRSMQFLANNIEIVGRIEGSEITQADLPRPKFGEGLLEAFDPGIF